MKFTAWGVWNIDLLFITNTMTDEGIGYPFVFYECTWGGGRGGPIKATVRSFPSLQTDFWFQLCKEWSTQGHVVIGRYVNDGVVRFLLHRCSLTSVLKDGQYFYPFVVTVIVYVILERLLQPPLFVNKIQLRTSPVNHNALHFEVLRNFKFQLNCE